MAPDEVEEAVAELVPSGRVNAVELAHPEFGAIRLIVVPRDSTRAAERVWHHDLRRELARARRRGWPLTVGAIAIDAGASTRGAAAAWANVLREEDSLAAHEDGAYLAILPDCSAEAAAAVAERIRAATPAPATVSIGFTAWVAGEDLESVVTRALGALAEARHAGSNQVVIAPAHASASG
ncbi:MAG TPA: hypothetical protein VH115_02970 [Solirubrobacteraceae bacterium]|nr:hypothetical protein [Solirubrobacteraceae bacterium]